MKKKLIITIGIILIILMISFFSRSKTKPTTPSPSPTPSAKNQFNLNELNSQESTQLIQDALKYGQALEKLNQTYPWYSKLPIETNEYRIIYDFDKKSFRIRLLQPTSPEIKQKALDALKNIGVDLTIFTYYFL